jgi:hypothetical protein
MLYRESLMKYTGWCQNDFNVQGHTRGAHAASSGRSTTRRWPRRRTRRGWARGTVKPWLHNTWACPSAGSVSLCRLRSDDAALLLILQVGADLNGLGLGGHHLPEMLGQPIPLGDAHGAYRARVLCITDGEVRLIERPTFPLWALRSISIAPLVHLHMQLWDYCLNTPSPLCSPCSTVSKGR